MFYSTIQLSEHIAETPQGFLLCTDVAIARTGSQQYRSSEIGLPGDTVLTVDRLEQDVFDPEAVASFNGMTVTTLHPAEFVTVDTWRDVTMGHLQNPRRGTGDQSHLLLGDMLVTGAEAIAQIKSGVREVSCGYDCQYVQDDAGQWRQTQIRGNHVAIVPRGRAGAECSIKDSIMKRVTDKIRVLFGKAQDEAIAEMTAALADPAPAATPATDAGMADIVANLQGRLTCMEQCKRETDETIAALQAAIAKLGEPASVVEDVKPPTMDADTIARVEILAPGATDAAAALTACYATADGKRVIDALNGGKAPTADDVARLLVPTSEVIKLTRVKALDTPAKTTTVVDAAAYLNKRAAEMYQLA